MPFVGHFPIRGESLLSVEAQSAWIPAGGKPGVVTQPGTASPSGAREASGPDHSRVKQKLTVGSVNPRKDATADLRRD